MRRALPVGLVLLALAGAGAGAGPAAGGWTRARRVAVPRVSATSELTVAYRVLRRAGLRMAIHRPFSISSLCRPTPGRQSPAAGTRVAPGTAVVVAGLRCPLASPAGGDRRAVVPDLRGRRAGAAVAWAEAAGLYWQLDRLAALRPSGRPELLDNYVVTGQSPAAGSVLGRGIDCSTAATRCYQVTPLRLSAREATG